MGFAPELLMVEKHGDVLAFQSIGLTLGYRASEGLRH